MRPQDAGRGERGVGAKPRAAAADLGVAAAGPAESPPTLDLLGTRGLPAAHGGFETFAERLALHLVARGWRVRVYGQAVGRGPAQRDLWRGIERVTLPVPWAGAFGTVVFDWRAIAEALRHARRHAEPPGLALTLGYNTAMFCARLRRAGWVQAINMDGLEWAREKWGPLARAWFRVNERAALHVAEHLVADHPVIEARLRDLGAGSVHGIAYGADAPPPADAAMQADEAAQLAALGLAPQRYLTLIARPEPENSVLEAVRGFSIRPRGLKLVVLGEYTDAQHYHRAVREAAGPEVRFPGPIYDAAVLRALRRHALAYVHGHRVGGTNPSLVEALAAGNPVIAHDNAFNRQVAADAAAVWFRDATGFDATLSALLARPERLAAMADAARRRHAEAYRWEPILARYEALLGAAWSQARTSR
jgi:glycosyltransferase involved in cell wall biosynthesis